MTNVTWDISKPLANSGSQTAYYVYNCLYVYHLWQDLHLFFYLWVSGSRQDWKNGSGWMFESTSCWLQKKNTREIWRYQKWPFLKGVSILQIHHFSFRGVMQKENSSFTKRSWNKSENEFSPPKKTWFQTMEVFGWKHGSLANHLMFRMVTRNQKGWLWQHLWGQGLTWICSQWPVGSSLYGPGWPRRM